MDAKRVETISGRVDAAVSSPEPEERLTVHHSWLSICQPGVLRSETAPDLSDGGTACFSFSEESFDSTQQREHATFFPVFVAAKDVPFDLLFGKK
ncbi:hypothetical protein D9C73_027212 [Collichthys lucidus]|uniref:Uncharacterized protein n=1 Tax=Collichthys lucidus TaxID=240159 RepID=A0A4V6XZ50_COLLU|nr:hypothetical protein D9C73_027212 [Collichthys lucidus]